MPKGTQNESGDSMLPVLLRLYVPVMLASLLIPAMAGGIVALIIGRWWALVIPIIWVMFCGLHLGYLLLISFKKLKREPDWFEMKLEAEQKVKLREFVVDIARRWDTPRPDDIRLSVASAAH